MDDQLPTDVAELQALLRKSREEVRAQERALSVAQQRTVELSSTVEEQRGKLAAAQQQIGELLRALRGKQRERVDPDQLLLFELGELETLLNEPTDEQDAKTSKRNRKRKRRQRLIPDDAPREERVYELPEEERLCPHDGKPMPLIRWETSYQLDYVPAIIKAIVHKRAVYACPEKHDEAKLVTAPKPPQPIEKGLAGPGLLAQMVVGKFGDHLPGYRLEDILSRHGVEIRRSTIYGWLASLADLVTPLVELMKSRVLQSQVIHTDDTQVKLIDKTIRSTRLARFWAYLGDVDHPYTIYDFTENRGRAGPTVRQGREARPPGGVHGLQGSGVPRLRPARLPGHGRRLRHLQPWRLSPARVDPGPRVRRFQHLWHQRQRQLQHLVRGHARNELVEPT